MFNPFEPFTPELINALQGKGYRWLVGQTMNRADASLFPGKTNILFTHYNDLGLAQAHQNAVKQDKYACILNLDKEPHLVKLQEMLGALSEYMVWIAMVRNKAEKDKQLDRKHKERMRKWIGSNTNWRFKADTDFKVDYQLIFGELMVVMRYSSQVERVPLSTIENY